MKRKKASRNTARKIHQWHQRIGISAALFIIWIVCSGWMLNHTNYLGMAHITLRNTLLANWYGLHSSLPTTVLTTSQHWLSNTNDNRLIIDGHLHENIRINAIGFIETAQFLAIASKDSVLLLDYDGKVIDTLTTTSLPMPHITELGYGCEGLVIKNQQEIYSSADGLDWQECHNTIIWSEKQAITPAQTTAIENLLVPPISLEKLVLDLHSGRFFGKFGPYVVDIIGGALLLLALSGLWMFFRTRKVRHKIQRKAHHSSHSAD